MFLCFLEQKKLQNQMSLYFPYFLEHKIVLKKETKQAFLFLVYYIKIVIVIVFRVILVFFSKKKRKSKPVIFYF